MGGQAKTGEPDKRICVGLLAHVDAGRRCHS